MHYPSLSVQLSFGSPGGIYRHFQTASVVRIPDIRQTAIPPSMDTPLRRGPLACPENRPASAARAINAQDPWFVKNRNASRKVSPKQRSKSAAGHPPPPPSTLSALELKPSSRWISPRSPHPPGHPVSRYGGGCTEAVGHPPTGGVVAGVACPGHPPGGRPGTSTLPRTRLSRAGRCRGW